MEFSLLTLMRLPEELLLCILSFLDIPDLLSVSRTCHHYRALSLDPILHSQRLHTASLRLSLSLLHRPSLTSLLPPSSAIYLSPTHLLARALSRKLVAIRLSRNLLRRPSPSSLIHANILPEECCRFNAVTGVVIWGSSLAPSILSVQRKIEREKLKDGLKAWLQRKASRVAVLDKYGGLVWEGDGGVSGLVKRFSAWRSSSNAGGRDGGVDAAVMVYAPVPEERWGRRAQERRRCEPARAKVLGLKRFWEGLASASQAHGMKV